MANFPGIAIPNDLILATYDGQFNGSLVPNDLILGQAAPICPPVPTPDTTAPVVQNFSPVAGSTLTPTDTVEFDVTDNSGSFARIMVVVAFDDGTQELVYDGLAFTARYLGASTVAATTVGPDTGFHFEIERIGGWIGSSITVRAFAVDAAGNTES